MGQLSWHHVRDAGIDSVFPADLHNVPAAASRQSEHSHDVHPNTRQPRLGS